MPDGDAAASDATSSPPPGHPLADAPASTNDASATQPATDDTTTAPDAETALAEARAELEKWKALSKKNEALARTNKAAADEHRRQQEAAMSDTEKAIAEARRQGRLEALVESGGRVVEATFRAAAHGRLSDASVTSLLASIDKRTFMDDEGNMDAAAVTAFVESIAPPPPPKVEESSNDPRWPDLGQGQQGVPPLNSSDLEKALRSAVAR